jgi:AMP-polyphosphate phosphotransferase
LDIDLSNFEDGEVFDGDFAIEREKLRQQLTALHMRHIANGSRTLIVLEGWDGSGKADITRLLGACFDPRFLNAYHIASDHAGIGERHFLWRFWQKLPGKGEITLFERSYYRRVLDERVDGLANEAEWKRAFDEINEFEAQQRDSGTYVIKFFLHINGEKQRSVFAKRMHDVDQRWTVTAMQLHRLATRSAYTDALHDMFSNCDTRWAPWKVIDAHDPEAAEIAVLRYLVEEWGKTVPSALPDINAETAHLAELVLGGVPA